jgi:cardiolipin synthase
MLNAINVGLVYDVPQLILLLLVAFVSFSAALHAVVHKRNSRAAFAWLGTILLSPLFSALMYLTLGWLGVLVVAPVIASALYLVIGINRMPRKFRKGRFRQLRKSFTEATGAEILGAPRHKWQAINRTGESLGYSPIQPCDIRLLNTGDEAYPAMLDAIAEARQSISLFSYIFSYDEAGKQFVNALIAAKKRGVEVRVLIDAVGSHRSGSKVLSLLEREGIACEAFLPVRLKTRFSNMRNHRKLLVVDAKTAFTGGLNIAEIYWPELAGSNTVIDTHFKITGSVVNYLQEVFVNDWFFASGEILKGTPWYDENDEAEVSSNSLARVVVDGPSREEERLRWHFLNAINIAEKNIKILTPYFLPDDGVVAALCSAALRGVKVEILVPEKSDSVLMDWALRGSLFEMLERGCKFYCIGPGFDHSKLLLVDDDYASIGSANWDARSLRLNFELNVEVYSEYLAAELKAILQQKKQAARPLLLDDLLARNRLVRIRDGIARLLGPYL